jgi:cupin fold WbuC family metalloprotein
MKIEDSKGNLIAQVINVDEADGYKQFYTKNTEDIQFGIFNLPNSEKIQKHYHPEQARRIKTTSEVLILLSGRMRVSLYDESQKHLRDITLNEGSVLITVSGGHGIEVLEDSKFIEIKQGPYDESSDKVRF